jgi:hypothetical protein
MKMIPWHTRNHINKRYLHRASTDTVGAMRRDISYLHSSFKLQSISSYTLLPMPPNLFEMCVCVQPNTYDPPPPETNSFLEYLIYMNTEFGRLKTSSLILVLRYNGEPHRDFVAKCLVITLHCFFVIDSLLFTFFTVTS